MDTLGKREPTAEASSMWWVHVCVHSCVKHLEIYPQNTEINNYQNFREKWINQQLEILTHPTRRLIECIKIVKFIDIEGIKIQ